MTVGHPWSGRDSNGLPQIFGRAAIPGFPNGGGFNWPSMARTTGWIRPGLRGLGTLRRRGRGLGQDTIPMGVDTSALFPVSDGTTPLSGDFGIPSSTASISASTPNLNSSVLNLTDILNSSSAPAGIAQGASATSASGAPWYASLLTSLAKTGSQIASFELNPLYQKSTFMLTPQGTVLATNQPTTGIPGLTTTAASLMPLLLIGGVVVIFMMMARR